MGINIYRIVTENFLDFLNGTLKLHRPQKIWIISAFITYDGAKELEKWILDSKTDVKLITGTYLDFTDPSAIAYLTAKYDLRVIDDNSKPLHAKAYYFEINRQSIVVIGSSNLTMTGLNKNIEWNAVWTETHSETQEFVYQFLKLWKNAITPTHKWIREYRSRYQRSTAFFRERQQKTKKNLVPRTAQKDALRQLDTLRNLGEDRALVVMPTGLGKTHLAAFDSSKYRKVLFLAHRMEILKQARDVFDEVRGFGNQLLFSDGWNTKEIADCLFATIQKMSRKNVLERFSKDFFDYIVIDEFHHSKANSYEKVIRHFEPQFLLGLTATPYRMDNKDILELCDRNVPYICTLPEAIEKNWLVPFEYHGIKDEIIDYSKIKWTSGIGYEISELTSVYSKSEWARAVLEKYLELGKKPAVAFCVSIDHANYMAEFFSKNKVPAIPVHSRANDPGLAKEKMANGEIEIIFAVDVFNEGIDVPDIRTILFLRPTQSLVVFLQQLGRGLRIAPGKDKIIVIDVIGNYRNSYVIPSLLLGGFYSHLAPEYINLIIQDIKATTLNPKRKPKFEPPKGCKINFDLNLIEDMLQRLRTVNPIRQNIIDEYLKRKSGSQRLQIGQVLQFVPYRTLIAAFKSTIDFYMEVGDLNEEEELLAHQEKKLLQEIEHLNITPIQISLLKEILLHQDFCIDENQLKTPHATEDIETVCKKLRGTKKNPFLKYEPTTICKNELINWKGLYDQISKRMDLLQNELAKKKFTPLHLYTRQDVASIFETMGANQTEVNTINGRFGLINIRSQRTLVMFVTLDKGKDYQNMMYRDHFVTHDTFQWESQYRTERESENGKIICEDPEYKDYRKFLFVRLKKNDPLFKNNYFYIGSVRLISYVGEKPISVKWKLDQPIPDHLLRYFADPAFRENEMPEKIHMFNDSDYVD